MSVPETSPSLGAAVKARRLEHGWSQEELAERVSAHGDPAFRQSDVSRLERGKVGLPHRERLGRIAAVLDLSLGELLARSGWSGAATAFADEEPEVERTADSPTIADASAGIRIAAPSFLPAQAPLSVNGIPDRLSLVIVKAEATRARAQQILLRSEELRELYNNPGRAPQHE